MANSITHARIPYPIKNARYAILVPYLDADGDPTDPTTPDTEFSLDAGSFADTAEEVTTITGSNGVGHITLTGAETNGNALALVFKVASGPKATIMLLYPRDLVVFESGTAQAGASGTITLASGATTIPIDGCFVRTTGGTGGGGTGGANNQVRRITAYNASTKVATIAPNWETTPSSDTTYDVLLPDGVTKAQIQTLNPTTNGRTLDVSTGGEAGVDWANVGSPTTTLNLSGTSTLALEPTTAGRKLDVTTTGEAGIDWANIGAPTTTVNLSGTTVKTATDVETDTQDIQSRLPAALSSGRMDSSVGQMQSGVMTSTAYAAGAITASAIAADAIGASELAADAIAEIADQVWDEILSGHAVSGSTGEALAAAGTAGDPWTTALPGAYGAGTAGKIIGDNINATISSRASQTSVDTIDDFVDTEVAAIKAKTDQLTFTTANQVDCQPISIAANAITATSIASTALTASKFGTGCITSDKIAVDAIGASELAADALEEIADAVWDELSAGHLAVGSFGQRMSSQDFGTAQAGAAGTITLHSGASSVNDFYNNTLIVITGGTGAGQSRFISDYVGSTKVATVSSNWITNPSSDSVFYIFPFGSIPGATAPSAADVADAVWDEVIAGHLTGGTTGAALNGAGSAGDPWSTSLPGAYTAGQAGAIIGNIDRSSRTIVNGTVGSASTVTSIVTSSLDPACTVEDQFVGRVVIFTKDTTTTNLRGQATVVEANTAGGTLTVTSLTTAPVSGDTFAIL